MADLALPCHEEPLGSDRKTRARLPHRKGIGFDRTWGRHLGNERLAQARGLGRLVVLPDRLLLAGRFRQARSSFEIATKACASAATKPAAAEIAKASSVAIALLLKPPADLRVCVPPLSVVIIHLGDVSQHSGCERVLAC